MLARGIVVQRTPQWEKQTAQAPLWMLGMGVIMLLIPLSITIVESSRRANAPSPLTINGKNMTMRDYNACGPNPPVTCPPHILSKYTRR